MHTVIVITICTICIVLIVLIVCITFVIGRHVGRVTPVIHRHVVQSLDLRMNLVHFIADEPQLMFVAGQMAIIAHLREGRDFLSFLF